MFGGEGIVFLVFLVVFCVCGEFDKVVMYLVKGLGELGGIFGYLIVDDYYFVVGLDEGIFVVFGFVYVFLGYMVEFFEFLRVVFFED